MASTDPGQTAAKEKEMRIITYNLRCAVVNILDVGELTNKTIENFFEPGGPSEGTVSASFTVTASFRVAFRPVFIVSTGGTSRQRRWRSKLHRVSWLHPATSSLTQGSTRFYKLLGHCRPNVVCDAPAVCVALRQRTRPKHTGVSTLGDMKRRIAQEKYLFGHGRCCGQHRYDRISLLVLGKGGRGEEWSLHVSGSGMCIGHNLSWTGALGFPTWSHHLHYIAVPRPLTREILEGAPVGYLPLRGEPGISVLVGVLSMDGCELVLLFVSAHTSRHVRCSLTAPIAGRSYIHVSPEDVAQHGSCNGAFMAQE